MKDGVIADFEVTEQMLRHFILKAHSRKTFVKPRVVICVPSGVTPVERRAVRESAIIRRRPGGLFGRRTHGGGYWGGTSHYRGIG